MKPYFDKELLLHIFDFQWNCIETGAGATDVITMTDVLHSHPLSYSKDNEQNGDEWFKSIKDVRQSW
jgi:hypothetical protein